MAYIYSRPYSSGTPNPDNPLILGIREAFRVPFDVGSWSSIRFVASVSTTGTGGDATVGPTEAITVGPTNHWAFGFKNNNDVLPGQVGGKFLGLATINGTSYNSVSASLTNVGAVGYGDTTLMTGSTAATTCPIHTGTYTILWICQLDVNNKGLSTQTVTVKGISSPPAQVSTTLTPLRAAAGTTALGLTNTITWNDGSVAHPLPDAVYVRLPLGNSRLRLHSMLVEKLA